MAIYSPSLLFPLLSDSSTHSPFSSMHPQLCISTPCCTARLGFFHGGHSSVIPKQRNDNTGCRICVKEGVFDENWGSFKKGVRHAVSVNAARAVLNAEPLKVMISGFPASGKGTQCELIVKKYGLVHIATGDLLRAEVAAGTDYGKKAKEYMDQGQLVPDDIVFMMVKERLAQPDAKEKGWLLDGYPRTQSQAESLEALGIRPHIFILINVPEEVLVDRVLGRRIDPLTSKIYHLKYSPPETPEVLERLVQRSDDTKEKVALRLQTYHQNMEPVFSIYNEVLHKVEGNQPKNKVFESIERLLTETPSRGRYKDSWKGIPTRLNSIPHTREIREYFYRDVCEATKRAVEDGIDKLKVRITIPELNPDMDVYRIGTLLELMRELAFTFANDGKRVKVCVQGSMGEGIFTGMPLQLAGTRRILEAMDWGSYGAKGTFINIGAIGSKEVEPEDDVFLLMAPQNSVGTCIIDDLQAMVQAAGRRPVIIVNPMLKDLPAAGGVMQIGGRETRMQFAASFFTCYNFRLLYLSGTLYPILGALRMKYPAPYEVYKRLEDDNGKEKYVLLATFKDEPSSSEIGDAFDGRLRKKDEDVGGFWSFLRVLVGS
ncbi:hypothetical protein O6H91_03G008700 [Diphasiastrum complanatum]|uniref:Uncharacterized protein n=1 Tax=Diphasiastrum complanatum TaxID=34168 RepID=A0ACC2E3C1_DIPCM|nr:hypothetical protein O6H91_Y173500 [Diphasiastrum complanatum]KAJ7560982.1 hypothetical protein O6H91_03G008700 [Diphasiastrum complanatum]